MEDARRLDDVRYQLRLIEPDADGAPGEFLRETLSELRSLMRTEKTLAYGLDEVANDRHSVGFAVGCGVDADLFARTVSDVLADVPVNWGLFNPACPEPEQRNRVLQWTSDEVVELVASGQSPIAARYYRFDAHERAQARALVCDGPSMLAWVGAWQPTPFDERQLAVLRLLVPDFKARLSYERALAESRRAPLLSAALDAVASVAFVVCASGRILHANAAAKKILDADPEETKRTFSRIVARPKRRRHGRAFH